MASASISVSLQLYFLLFISAVLPISAGQINITAVIGENKVLPCRAENRPIIYVEWRRTDIEEENVLRYRGQVDPEDQHPSFKNRVVFQEIEMKDGNVSLVFINVRMNDAGTYEAEVVYEGTKREKKLICSIHLDVAPPPPPPPPPPGSFPSWAIAPLVIAGVLLLIVSGFHFCWLLSMSERLRRLVAFHGYCKVKQVKVGKESVLLSCRTTDKLPGDVRVEWMDWGNRKVHVFKNGSDQPEQQDQLYRTRTKMNKYPLITGDFSLTLRHPTERDIGLYTCRVYSKEGKILMKKEVHLLVKAFQVEVEEGAESVLLPFNTTLPEELGEVTVVWTDVGRDRKIHVYETGSDQPGGQSIKTRTTMNNDALKTGDFSLTLENPTMEDSGPYRCRVMKDGDELRRKTFNLTVKAKTGSVQNQPENIRTRTTNQAALMAEQAV